MQRRELFTIIIPPQDITCEPGLQQQLANGDKDAFAWLYKHYCRRIYNYVLLLVMNECRSEDIVQDVFIKLWVNRERLRDHDNFNGYIYTLAKNHTLNVLRGEKKARINDERYLRYLKYISNDVDEFIAHRELQRSLNAAIKELPKTPQKVFVMRDKGMSNPAIANLLCKTEKTIRGQYYEAVKCLKNKISSLNLG